MTENYVSFITNEHLINCIEELYDKYEGAKTAYNQVKFNKNKVDIFKMLFDKKFNSLTDEELIEKEISRQIDKTITNAIGIFHENILAGIVDFEKLETGIDIKSADNKIFIELKNKHNTVKGEDKKGIFTKLQSEIKTRPNAKAYFARILDTASNNKIWSFSNKGTPYENERVLIISGDQLYHLLTGRENALYQLYKALPDAIDDFLASKSKDETNTMIQSTALREIKDAANEANRTIFDQITFTNYSYYLGFDDL